MFFFFFLIHIIVPSIHPEILIVSTSTDLHQTQLISHFQMGNSQLISDWLGSENNYKFTELPEISIYINVKTCRLN